jgi:hypothetical protein
VTPDPTLLEGTGTTGTGTFIANYDLQDYIPVPVAGEEPVKKIDQEDMVIAVAWKDKDGGNIPNSNIPDFTVFAAGVVYRATLSLSANEGFSL